MKRQILTALILAAAPAHANEFASQLEALARGDLAAIASASTVIDAVRHQNEAHTGLTDADIIAMDDDWRAQVGSSNHPLIDDLMGREASNWIRAEVDSLGGIVSEVFVTDNHGLNVMQSAVTSDYWQGDEAKWTETYGKPVGTIHLGDVEFDESSQAYQSQVSMPVTDPATGEPLGAITFGINVEALQ